MDRPGELYVSYHRTTSNELMRLVNARKARYGEIAIMIGADQSNTFKDVWSLLDLCRRSGMYNLRLRSLC
jgi:biopolymer transport protein ExbD